MSTDTSAGRLAGKVALVTGAGAGIGRGIARRFAHEGALVVIAEVDQAAGDRVAAEIVELGGTAKAVRCDVSRKAEITGVVGQTVREHGRLDVLVNNATAMTPNVVLEEKTDEMLDATLRVGLWATWWAMHAALPAMREQGGGRVINFYSIDAEAAAWLHTDYNINKEAIRALTRSAAAEWGRYGIRVNAIAPGAAGTVFWQLAAENPGFEERAAAMRPLNRIGDPEADVAPVAAFLASEESQWITGETIHPDGGVHLARYNSKPDPLP